MTFTILLLCTPGIMPPRLPPPVTYQFKDRQQCDAALSVLVKDKPDGCKIECRPLADVTITNALLPEIGAPISASPQ